MSLYGRSLNYPQTVERPVANTPRIFVVCNMISTAQPGKSSGNNPASRRESREALAWSPLQDCPLEMIFMHFISQADMNSEEKGAGWCYEKQTHTGIFLLVNLRWPAHAHAASIRVINISAKLLSFMKWRWFPRACHTHWSEVSAVHWIESDYTSPVYIACVHKTFIFTIVSISFDGRRDWVWNSSLL